MRILVANDDGVRSPGIHALAEAMAPLGEVWVVAPDRERSAASHSISLHRPLRLAKVDERVFTTDGTPADCVYLAVNHLLKGTPPDLIVSGINHGPNLADDVTYSGTIAAAFEGTLMGIPTIAFSICARGKSLDTLPFAAAFAQSLVRATLEHRLPPGIVLNVNFPAKTDGKTYRLTRQGKRSYGAEVLEKEDPRGRKYYWIGGDELAHENVPGSDANAVYDEGIISVTPLHLNLTHERSREEMSAWKLPGTVLRSEPA